MTIPNTPKENSEAELEVATGGVFASETSEQEQETLQIYKLATANSVLGSDYGLDANGVLLNSHDNSEYGFVFLIEIKVKINRC